MTRYQIALGQKPSKEDEMISVYEKYNNEFNIIENMTKIYKKSKEKEIYQQMYLGNWETTFEVNKNRG
jgi:hypothetical protein